MFDYRFIKLNPMTHIIFEKARPNMTQYKKWCFYLQRIMQALESFEMIVSKNIPILDKE